MYQMRVERVSLLNVKVLASIVGQIISMQGVLGKIVRLKSRDLYKCILTRASWKAPVIVSQETIEELRFWRCNVGSMNTEGKAIERSTLFEVCLFSDASSCSSGYGGYLESTTQHKASVEGRSVPNESDMTECCQNVNELSQMELYDEGKGKHCFRPLEVSNRENTRTPPEMGMKLPPEVGDQSKYSVNPEVGSTVSPEGDMGSIRFNSPEVDNCTCICTNVLTNACRGKIQFQNPES